MFLFVIVVDNPPFQILEQLRVETLIAESLRRTPPEIFISGGELRVSRRGSSIPRLGDIIAQELAALATESQGAASFIRARWPRPPRKAGVDSRYPERLIGKNTFRARRHIARSATHKAQQDAGPFI